MTNPAAELPDKDIARQKVEALVASFEARHDLRGMNETQLRLSFIDPLFEALGWQVRDPDEVSVEVNIARKRVDYTFRLNHVTRFVVEAKAPSVDLNGTDPITQAVTYAFNKGVNWAVLTNFRDLRVFSAEEGRPFITLGHAEYVSNFDTLWLLSKTAWESGSFEREAGRYGAMRPSVPVERSLFGQLREWRETLFTEIHRYNDDLSIPVVEERIQQLLNRLMFIRTAEDRGIEEHRLLAALHQSVGSANAAARTS